MKEKILSAEHQGSPNIGNTELNCAVLEDGTRVLISKDFLTALGRPWKGSSRTELPNFLGAKNLIPFVSNELKEGPNPIQYQNIRGQKVLGFKAEILPLVCDVYLKARDENKLTAIGQHTNLNTDQIGELFREARTKDADYALSVGIINEIRDVNIPPGSPIISLVFQR